MLLYLYCYDLYPAENGTLTRHEEAYLQARHDYTMMDIYQRELQEIFNFNGTDYPTPELLGSTFRDAESLMQKNVLVRKLEEYPLIQTILETENPYFHIRQLLPKLDPNKL